MSDKPVLSDPILSYKNDYFEVLQSNADFGSYQKEYFSINFGRRVGIVLCKNRALLLVRQYRFFLRQKSWEIPGGQVHDHEEPKDAAIRECYEESGFTPICPQGLINYNVGHEGVNNPTSVFYSQEYEYDNNWEQANSETQEIHWVEIKECLKMIEKGEISDSLSIIAILAYQEKYSTNI